MEVESLPQNTKEREIEDNPKPDQAASNKPDSIWSALRQLAAKGVGKVAENTGAVIGAAIGAAILTTIALVLGVITAPKQMTPDTFNIAIAEFGQVGEDGKTHRWEEGENLSKALFNSLSSEFNVSPGSADIEPRVLVWHDSMDWSKKGTKIDVIAGDADAAAKASLINAQLIIYGNLKTDMDRTAFVPEFYVADDLPDGREIIGNQQLGSSIKTSPKYMFNARMSVRTRVLTLFAQGLTWETWSPEKALSYFERAKDVDGWGDHEGKELVYLFIGRELTTLGRSDEAMQAFEKALEINRNYVRAHIGKGNVYFDKASQIQTPAALLESNNDVDKAINEYKQVLELVAPTPSPKNSTGTILKIKAHIGLASAYSLKGGAYLDLRKYDQAIPFYDDAITETIEAQDAISQNKISGQESNLAHTYYVLGEAYRLKGWVRATQAHNSEAQLLYEKAIAAYDKCISKSSADPSDNLTDKCTDGKAVANSGLADLKKGGH